ncbi:MAG TPA: hypothetical protein VEU06_04600 [Micropepsaceae bacterium]|nr:hypothetical protein [Micropepsaceae bacterium]
MSSAVSPFRRTGLRTSVETVVTASGVLLVLGAIAADQDWFDRHFLPEFFFSRDAYVLGERLGRLFLCASGVALVIFVRPALGRLAENMSARQLIAATARILLAVALALMTSELTLRYVFPDVQVQGPVGEEPLRRPDARLGWTFEPARSKHATVNGREIEYVIDRFGYRVERADGPVDPNLPTIVFTGESMMAGLGLTWEESIPAQTGTLLKMQTANLAVFGYANDQAYLHLARELPRFRQPVALVSLFSPDLFVRNLDDDRPHLGPRLDWHPSIQRLRLSTLVKAVVPYHSDAEIGRGIEATKAVLRATEGLARARHAVSLVVVPEFGPESSVEETLRQRVLNDAGISYVLVELDPTWRIPGDMHPDPRAAHAIAAAVAARLQPSLATALPSRSRP